MNTLKKATYYRIVFLQAPDQIGDSFFDLSRSGQFQVLLSWHQDGLEHYDSCTEPSAGNSDDVFIFPGESSNTKYIMTVNDTLQYAGLECVEYP